MKISLRPTAILTVWPFSTPAGTGTVTFLRCTVCPLPSHSKHGYLLYCPEPEQYLHVDRITNGPVDTVSIPLPLQYWHFDGLVPSSHREPWHLGHVSTVFNMMSLFTPRAACANVRFIVTSCAAPNPKLESAKSLKSCLKFALPKIFRNNSSGSMVERYSQCWLNPWWCPWPGAPPLRCICSVVWPYVSYSRRLVSSLRISYASETSWNFLPASASSLFVSGWYFFANW